MRAAWFEEFGPAADVLADKLSFDIGACQLNIQSFVKLNRCNVMPHIRLHGWSRSGENVTSSPENNNGDIRLLLTARNRSEVTGGACLKESDTVDSALNRRRPIVKTPPGIAE